MPTHSTGKKKTGFLIPFIIVIFVGAILFMNVWIKKQIGENPQAAKIAPVPPAGEDNTSAPLKIDPANTQPAQSATVEIELNPSMVSNSVPGPERKIIHEFPRKDMILDQ